MTCIEESMQISQGLFVLVSLVVVPFASLAHAESDDPHASLGASAVASKAGGVSKAGGAINANFDLGELRTVFGTDGYETGTASLGMVRKTDGSGKFQPVGDLGVSFKVGTIKGQRRSDDFKTYLIFDGDMIKARPHMLSTGLHLGGEMRWTNGGVSLSVPLLSLDQEHVNRRDGASALSGGRVVADQELLKILRLKATLEGRYFWTGSGKDEKMNGGGSYASAALSADVKLGEKVSVGVVAQAERMSTSMGKSNEDGSIGAPVRKTVTPTSPQAPLTRFERQLSPQRATASLRALPGGTPRASSRADQTERRPSRSDCWMRADRRRFFPTPGFCAFLLPWRGGAQCRRGENTSRK